MKKPITYIVMFTYLAWGHSTVVNAADKSLERWQLDMIYQPSEAVLEREQRGFVHIYDGFSDTRVERILDDRFERMQHMMFTGVRLTDADGEILLDPVTGEELTADDGCD